MKLLSTVFVAALLALLPMQAQTTGTKAKNEARPATSSEQYLSDKLAGMKVQVTADVLQQLRGEIEMMKQQIRQELRTQLAQEIRTSLKQELRMELKQELRMELKQELKQEIKQELR